MRALYGSLSSIIAGSMRAELRANASMKYTDGQ